MGLSEDLTPPLYIDSYAAIGVLKLPKPTTSEVESIIVKDKVRSERLSKITNHDIYLPILNETSIFYSHCLEIQQFMMHQRYVWSSTDNMTENAMLINVADLHYTSYDLDPLNTVGNDVLYSEWLEERGILIEDLEREEYLKLAGKIAGLATGAGDSSSRTVQDMHIAMIGLMENLSSYSIQYLRSITNAELIP